MIAREEYRKKREKAADVAAANSAGKVAAAAKKTAFATDVECEAAAVAASAEGGGGIGNGGCCGGLDCGRGGGTYSGFHAGGLRAQGQPFICVAGEAGGARERGNEHHQLTMAPSRPADGVDGSGGFEGSGGGRGGKGSRLKPPASIKDMKKEGQKGAGLPVRRDFKRNENTDDRKTRKTGEGAERTGGS